MTHAPIEDILPLSPLQKGLLFHALRDTTDVYTVQLSFELLGKVNLASLRAAAKAAVNRHTALRVSLRHEDVDQPVQLVHPRVGIPWRQVDLSRRTGTDAEEAYQRLLDEDRHTRFELAAPPLLRFVLVRFAPDRFRLLITFHHLLIDGWSLPIFLGEFFTLYAHDGDSAALPPVPPYRRYVSWYENQDHEAALRAWGEALNGLEEPTLVAPAHTSVGLPERVEHLLDAEVTEQLALAAKAQGLTMNTLIQAAWALTLGAHTGREDVVFGTVVSGRPAEVPGVASMVGLFANTLPVRARLRPELSLRDFLTGLHEQQTQLMDQHHVTLSEITRSVNAGGTGELFDTLAVFENYPVAAAANEDSLGDLTITSVKGRDAAHFPLMLTVMPGERLRLAVDYQPDAFDDDTARRTAGRVGRLLELIAQAPDTRLAQVEVLTGDERVALVSWNATGSAVRVGTVGEVFGEQVAATPDAVAVVSGVEELTYR
ncbi:condensation domain-containing protein, partial [Streptomyces noursei]|uniref:condensation domain-containing protein n=1 Tax=Streptomyces noursei TaxID=1971 RepID=UPI0030EFA8B6